MSCEYALAVGDSIKCLHPELNPESLDDWIDCIGPEKYKECNKYKPESESGQ